MAELFSSRNKYPFYIGAVKHDGMCQAATAKWCGMALIGKHDFDPTGEMRLERPKSDRFRSESFTAASKAGRPLFGARATLGDSMGFTSLAFSSGRLTRLKKYDSLKVLLREAGVVRTSGPWGEDVGLSTMLDDMIAHPGVYLFTSCTHVMGASTSQGMLHFYDVANGCYKYLSTEEEAWRAKITRNNQDTLEYGGATSFGHIRCFGG